jgi:Fe-S-cluster containining protein
MQWRVGMDEQCVKCDAKCCRYFCFEIDEPESYEEFDDIRWFLLHEGVSVHIDEGDWFISIMNRCKMLGADNRCQAYEDRPLICRKYSPDNCDWTSGDYGYDELFETPEQIEAYARKILGKKKFERQKARLQAKCDRRRPKGAGKDMQPAAAASRPTRTPKTKKRKRA